MEAQARDIDLEAPFDRMDGRALGPWTLRITDWRRETESGWRRFHLALVDEAVVFPTSLMEGVYSFGGRGVEPWIEVLAYRPRLEAEGRTADLTENGLETDLFVNLGQLIPPGGHLMVGCENEPQRDTYQALRVGVPPAATPLGSVLYHAGFPRIRFFDLAEGGWEGQQKLWAERPLDAAMDRDWRRGTLDTLRRFVDEDPEAEPARQCIPIACDILERG